MATPGMAGIRGNADGGRSRREHTLPGARPALGRVELVGDVPFATALIEGHTDSVGTEAYNLALSDRRAKSVFDYLTSRGVDPARLSSVGHGESKPIADNATTEGRQLNRRVMLIRTDTGT